MKNQLIDVLDTLVSTGCPEGRWTAAEELSQQMGISSILVAELRKDTKEFNWINTNLPSTWMDEYIGENYAQVDPFVANLGSAPGSASIEAGTLDRTKAVSDKAWALNHALKGFGVGSMHCTNFGVVGENGKLVTLSFAQSLKSAKNEVPTDIALFSALLASVIGPNDAPSNHQFARKAALTTRQREVLSCLAEGMMNSRIAEKLGISEAAVAFHFTNAKKALGANTREHALALAMKHGLISV